MPTIPLQIVRLTDSAFPGWVECLLRDAQDREWVLADKLPVFTEANLDAGSEYPQPGAVACEIIREWEDEGGRGRCMVSTERPWGVAAVGGETEFEVFTHQVMGQMA